MLIDDLRQELKKIESDITAIKSFWEKSNNTEKLKSLVSAIIENMPEERRCEGCGCKEKAERAVIGA